MGEDAGHRSGTFGERELSALSVTTMAALYEAGFIGEMENLRRRVLGRGASGLLEEVEGADGRTATRYRPMVELLLLHVRDAALSTRPESERRGEILWAIEMAGF
jgi:hypothetical protein